MQRRNRKSVLSRAAESVCAFESLEQRKLMSVSYSNLTGQLSVTGTSGNDTISVSVTSPGSFPSISEVQVHENGVRTFSTPLFVNRINIDAGDGNDSVSIGATLPRATVQGGAGNDTINSGGGDDYLDGWTGNDFIYGGAGNDQILGWDGFDYLHGQDGNDSLYGEAGADNLFGGNGADYQSGGSDVDWAEYSDRSTGVMISLDNLANDGSYTNAPPFPDPVDPFVTTEADNVQSDVENVRAGSGNDRITSPAATVINNTFWGGTGNDYLAGGAGNDSLDGMSGNDIVSGGSANDTVLGGWGFDILSGEDGNDRLDGGVDNDSVYGDSGMDVLVGDSGADRMYGGPDMDTADYSTRFVALNVSLDDLANDGASGENDDVRSDIENVNGGSGADTITSPASRNLVNVFNGNGGNDSLDGGGSDDVLSGGSGSDLVCGNTGHDQLSGGANDDVIFGNAGADIIRGEDGNDRLYGGADADWVSGGNNDDTIVVIGGSGSDSVRGDSGFDSFWMDSDATEVTEDAPLSADFLNELVNGNLHRIGTFTSLRVDGVGTFSVSKELNGQNIVDPTPNAGDMYGNFNTNPLFASGGPSMNDIRQGGTGDCWFLATLSAVAKVSPNRIRQSVVDLGDGTYGVRFWDGSTQKYYRVDHQRPTGGTGVGLGASNSMWVAMMEKAFCFFRDNEGTYDSISGGKPEEAFNALGQDTVEDDGGGFWGYNSTELAEALATDVAQGKAVVFCTDPPPAGNPLVGDHCYMVDRVIRNGSGVITGVVMRNPWGSDLPDGTSTDGNNDGWITVSPQQALAAFDDIHSAFV